MNHLAVLKILSMNPWVANWLCCFKISGCFRPTKKNSGDPFKDQSRKDGTVSLPDLLKILAFQTLQATRCFCLNFSQLLLICWTQQQKNFQSTEWRPLRKLFDDSLQQYLLQICKYRPVWCHVSTYQPSPCFSQCRPPITPSTFGRSHRLFGRDSHYHWSLRIH